MLSQVDWRPKTTISEERARREGLGDHEGRRKSAGGAPRGSPTNQCSLNPCPSFIPKSSLSSEHRIKGREFHATRPQLATMDRVPNKKVRPLRRLFSSPTVPHCPRWTSHLIINLTILSSIVQVLLMGAGGSGKTSMKSIIFANFLGASYACFSVPMALLFVCALRLCAISILTIPMNADKARDTRTIAATGTTRKKFDFLPTSSFCPLSNINPCSRR